jgi:alkylation response protein AidB-like acyl-CoA dehydrogenase
MAQRDGDDYIVNGSKIWTSYVGGADYCFLLVRTDPDSSRNRGITVLLAPMDAPGIEVREIPTVIGARYFHELFFSKARIPASARLGGEGDGWAVVSYALAFERVGAARYARAALTLDALADHAAERGILSDASVQEKLGAARTAVEASRVLTYRVIDLRARGSEPTADTNLARIAGTLCETAVSDLALEIFGSEGLAEGHFAEAYYRMAMSAGVAVGTTEVNLNLVSSRWLGLPRE